jgi:hypothetical protein
MLLAANAEEQLEAVAAVFDSTARTPKERLLALPPNCDVCEASNIRSGHHALTATRVTADAADRSKESEPNGSSIDPRSILDR